VNGVRFLIEIKFSLPSLSSSRRRHSVIILIQPSLNEFPLSEMGWVEVADYYALQPVQRLQLIASGSGAAFDPKNPAFLLFCS
jgi:hypothetical protein